MSTQSNFWLILAIALGCGFPLITVVLEEVIQRLKRRSNKFASTLQLAKTFVLPSLILLIFLLYVFRLNSEDPLFKLLETLFWLSLLNLLLSLVYVWLLAETKTWRSRIPKLLINLGRFVCIWMACSILLDKLWGVNPVGLYIILSVICLIVGIALKDPLASLLNGILLAIERPFQEGDWLQVGEVQGQVLEIDWRTIRLVTVDGQVIFIPYQVISQGTVCNLTSPKHIPSSLEVSFSYDNPPNIVKRLLTSTALSVKGVLAAPPPECHPLSYGESAINYELKFYIEDFKQVKAIRGELLSLLWYAARRQNLVLYQYNYECQVESLAPKIESSKSKLVQAFSSIPTFTTIIKEQRQLDDLVKGTTVQYFGAGEQIIAQGQRVHSLRIILSGSGLMNMILENQEELTIGTLSNGAFLGVQSLFTRTPSSVSVVAAEDTEVMVVNAQIIDGLMLREPNLSREMAKLIEVRENLIHLAKRAYYNEKRAKQKELELEEQMQLDFTILRLKP